MLQNYARRHTLAIDLVHFEFEVTADAAPATHPAEGVYINGLFIEGCRWDAATRFLAESTSKQLSSELPAVWLRPAPVPTDAPLAPSRAFYNVPLYKTTARRGTLTTTGHSTNFVLDVRLPSQHPEHHWLKRGVALVCALDD